MAKPPINTPAGKSVPPAGKQPGQDHSRMERFKETMDKGVPKETAPDPEKQEDPSTDEHEKEDPKGQPFIGEDDDVEHVRRAIYSHRELTKGERGYIIEVEQKAGELRELLDRHGMSHSIEIAKMHVEEAVMWLTRHITS